MSEQALIELLRMVAPYAFVLVLGFVFRTTIREKILPNVASIEGFGFKIGLVAKKLDEAVEEHRGSSGASVLPPAPAERLLVLRRAQRLARLLQGARMLWIDPNPRGNRYEIELLRSLGIGIDLARSSGEADELLKAVSYDVVVSNIKRAGSVDGVTSLSMVRDELDKKGIHLPPVVWYVADPRPTIDTSLALGITNRPDQLLHYVFDGIERKRS